jgi:hypothetical protein
MKLTNIWAAGMLRPFQKPSAIWSIGLKAKGLTKILPVGALWRATPDDPAIFCKAARADSARRKFHTASYCQRFESKPFEIVAKPRRQRQSGPVSEQRRSNQRRDAVAPISATILGIKVALYAYCERSITPLDRSARPRYTQLAK